MVDISQTLDFAIRNNLNVILNGKHGVGKTAQVIEAFENAGIRYKVFSASTLDPWIDFIGVPKEYTREDGTKVLDMVRPAWIFDGSIEAIFLDEYSRCLVASTKIPLLDGSEVEIKDLVDRDEFYVYSYDIATDRVEVGRGHSARITGKKEKVLRVTLDNGESIVCTPDHPFLTREGGYKCAEHLVPGESLMPLYRRKKPGSPASLGGYEQVRQPNEWYTRWEYTHWLSNDYNVRNGAYDELDGIYHRHHIDKNYLNNLPSNIQVLSPGDHILKHASEGGVAAHKIHPDLYDRTIGRKETRKKALATSSQVRKNDPTYKDRYV